MQPLMVPLCVPPRYKLNATILSSALENCLIHMFQFEGLFGSCHMLRRIRWTKRWFSKKGDVSFRTFFFLTWSADLHWQNRFVHRSQDFHFSYCWLLECHVLYGSRPTFFLSWKIFSENLPASKCLWGIHLLPSLEQRHLRPDFARAEAFL